MDLAFTKGHGTENDFVLLFDPAGAVGLTPDLVRLLCDRRCGIGADGVIRAVHAGFLGEPTGLPDDTWFMDYWNADGTTAEMCGNGARVFAALLEERAEADLSAGLTFGTRGGTRTATSVGRGRYSVTMGPATIGESDFDSMVAADGLHPARPALTVDVGNPHRVVALASPDELEALDLASQPQVEPPPPEGANVEFVVALGESADGSRGRVRMRVHERGAGETRSCGTGACAVAAAVARWAGPGAPRQWDVEVPGGELVVTLGAGETLLDGPAVLVYDGSITLP